MGDRGGQRFEHRPRMVGERSI
uniref:Uncharacterized protein n=1 Tax=Arundo donax TaxID=35708 RepID=A0A0A9C675_ARUDO